MYLSHRMQLIVLIIAFAEVITIQRPLSSKASTVPSCFAK